ncbi:MAG: carbohydrate binding family 9 domain-containing protein, partial [Acidobacteria bacterium]|nr:carbohydrate binding family 9 domain-containing protein [Acidobacteriota bacterium]
MHGAGAEEVRESTEPIKDVSGIRTTHGLRAAIARRIDGNSAVHVDGNLDEAVWQEAPINMGFLQREPEEGASSSERTEFRVLYDRKTLYIAVICYDSEPGKVLATERQRDSRMQNDDTIAILLDTFHDHRNFYMFRTNPLGTQADMMVTDEGRDRNAGWDAEWEVGAQMHAEMGWTLEFAIPFKSLRLAGTEDQVWGLDVERVIRRKNEFSYWNSFKRGFTLMNISQGGHLRGLGELDPGFRLRVKPFSVAGFSRSANDFSSATKDAMDGGMEIMKLRITPSLMADFAFNSNFIDTEIDTQQVNMDRWDLFYPERREFFQEAGIFKFGVAQGEMPAPDVALFHTRQMGYYSKREGSASRQIEVPITAGARLTGKVKGFSLGLLNIQTGEVPGENVPESNYGVIRIKRDILDRSAIGAFFLNREIAGTRDSNRVYGFDTNFIFKEHFFTNFLFARSIQPCIRETLPTGETTSPNCTVNRDGSLALKDNWTLSGSAKWDSDSMYAGLEYLIVDPQFRDDLGFVPRPNQRRISPVFDIKPRIQRLSHIVRKFQFGVRMDYITDQGYKLNTRYMHYNAQIFFQSGDHILIAPHTRFERVTAPFELRRGVTIQPGDYYMNNIRIAYQVNPAKRIAGDFVFQPQWGFFGGDMHHVAARPRIKVSQSLTLVPGYTWNRFTSPKGNFTDHIVNTGIEYAFNNQWLTSTVV